MNEIDSQRIKDKLDECREMLELLRGDDFISHESGEPCITCNRPSSRDTWPYCALCATRHQRDYANEELARLQADANDAPANEPGGEHAPMKRQPPPPCRECTVGCTSRKLYPPRGKRLCRAVMVAKMAKHHAHSPR